MIGMLMFLLATVCMYVVLYALLEVARRADDLAERWWNENESSNVDGHTDGLDGSDPDKG